MEPLSKCRLASTAYSAPILRSKEFVFAASYWNLKGTLITSKYKQRATMCSTTPFIALGGRYLGVINFDVWYLVLAVTGRNRRRRNAYEDIVRVTFRLLL